MKNIDNFLEQEYSNIIEDLKKITLVAAPPFKEHNRISYLKKYIENLGFNSIVDKEGNLIVALQVNSNKTVIFSAHIDTVFSEGTELKVIEENGKIFCPGICDNSAGIVALLYLLRYIRLSKPKFKNKFVFLFNVGEEELGNLRGIKYFIDNMDKTKINAHIVIEGHKIGRVTTQVVGSHRRRVSIVTQGGHSWRDYGKPNAVLIAANIVNEISKINFPTSPKTTFNIGTFSGGGSVNSVPQKAEFTLEIRSLEQNIINKKIEEIDNILHRINDAKINSEILGERPCGIMQDQELINLIKRIHSELGIKSIEDIGSTDSNYPISLGISSLTIGITDANNTHSTNEYLYTEPIKKGIKQLIHIFEELN